MSEHQDDTMQDAVAIIGMSCRFPGAESVDEYWQNLKAGAESITVFSDAELLAAGIKPETVADPNYVKARGLIKDPELFDAAFFGISPREAELMDPQQRLFLESCWHAMESAGQVPSKIEGSVGVWGGMSTGMTNNTYLLSNLHANNSSLDAADVLPTMLGNENDYLTTRVSYKLNLRGPSINVQSACSTSLVAAAQAFQSLMTYGCDMALAGGVSVSFPQKDGYMHQEGDIGSPDGHCRPFDENARGTVFSNGVGVVLMKRLEDALADDDYIYAVIRGVALNNDGSSKVSFAAPSVDGQAEVIAMAQAIAEVEPSTVSYIETHGTGTALGDPIEFAGLVKAFGDDSKNTGYCGLGSVKSNFGHLDSAAGVAALIKTALCLHHKTLVPTLHFNKPNPGIDLNNSPFYVCRDTKAWDSAPLPRRAGVSGFGIGGTNAHLVLEEAPERRSEPKNDAAELLLLSAKTEVALKQAAANLAAYLQDSKQPPSLADVSHTLATGREQFRHRLSLVATSTEQAARALGDYDKQRISVGKASAAEASVVFMFPGGGAQYHNMAQGLYHSDAEFRSDIDKGLALFQQRNQYDLASLWFAKDSERDHAVAELERPSVQLPAIFILEMALAGLWMRRGITPDALIGHSMGENTAACLAGVMSYEDALGLVSLRGELFEQVAAGGMLSVALSAADVQAYLHQGLCLATVNAPDQCTISGAVADIETLAQAFERDGIDAQSIPIKVAAHSHLLDPILEPFGDYLRSISLRPPSIPMISNRSGDWLSDEQASDPQYWVEHLRHTVLFADGVRTLAELDQRVFLEVGPGRVLGSLVRLQQSRFASRVIPSLRHALDDVADSEVLLAACGRLWNCGVNLEHEQTGLWAQGQHIPLPLYPFQRKRFLVEPTTEAPEASVPAAIDAMPVVSNVAINLPVANEYRSNAVPSIPRKQRILDKLRAIIQELSGLEIDDIEPQVSFVDMGFDSLFLTQANLRFKKEFRIKITFRQLFDDAPCLDALSQYIDEQLPESALPEEQTTQINVASNTPASAQVPAMPAIMPTMQPIPTGDNPLMQALALQMQASNALFALLQGNQLDGTLQPQPVTGASPIAAMDTKPAVQAPSSQPAEFKAKQLGPYKPLDTGVGGLNADAKSALDLFIANYGRRTAGSKALAEKQRGILSDARSISGFRADWKEMVYQIAAGTGSKGTRIYDVDGNEYIDLTSGFGINLFGYSPDWLVEAVQHQLDAGFELGTLSPLAMEAAELISELTGMERSTFTNTGSEAISAAIRAARTTTGKDKIAVFYNEYHGIADEVLVNYLLVNGERKTIPTSPGIPESLLQNVIVLEYDDPRCIDIIRDNADDLAAVIIEPVQNRNPAYRSDRLFAEIREVTRDNEIAMIFDEMITGFRLHPGGAQAYFNVEVDMCCYGKIVCGGLPLAVVAGRGEYLDCFDGGPWQFGDDSFPEAGVTFFGGTYTRHPLSLASSVAALRHIKSVGISAYDELNRRSRRFANELNEILVGAGYPARIENRESIFNLKVEGDNPFYRLIFWYLRHKGVLIYDRPFFISTEHSDADFDFIKTAFSESISELQRGGIVPPTDIGGGTGLSRVIPFTEAQTEIWLASLLGDDASRAYHEQVIYHLNGSIDVEALRSAMQHVVARHEGLRATVASSGDGIIIAPAQYIPVPLIDLSDEPRNSRPQALDAMIEDHVNQDFDLHYGPLTRLSLVKLADNQFVLLWAAHHIIIDGWSMGIMLKDLADYYSAASQGEKFGSLAEQQLSAYMALEHEHIGSEEYAAAQEYWISQYADGVPEPVQLPLDHPRPALKTFNGHRLAVSVNSALCEALRSYSNDNNCTVFTTLFTVFSVLLHKLSGQSDLVVGVPVAGQAVWGQTNLVGHCVSFLPFHTCIDSDNSFAELLTQTRNMILDANEHQHFTYGGLLKNLDISRDPSRAPLVAAIFNLDQGMESFDFDGVSARYAVCPRQYVKHDLFFNVVDESHSITLEVDYNSDLFDADSVSRWIEIYQLLLEQLVASPTTAIKHLQTIDTAARTKLALEWNSTAVDYPLDDINLMTLFEDAVDKNPDNIALMMGTQSMTYADLEHKANQLAAWLRRQDVGPDQVIPVIMDRSPEMLIALYGILKAGAAYLPLDPSYPDHRLQFILKQSGARIVLCQALFAEQVPEDYIALALDTSWQVVEDESSQRLPLAASADNLAYVIYTSGSSGEPKGVMIEHRAICNRLLWMAENYPLNSEDRVLQKTPYTFDVSVWELFLPLLCGSRLVLAEPDGHKSTDYLIDTIKQYHITQLHFVPTMLKAFLANEASASCTGIKRVICSGEALGRDLQDLFYETLPNVELHNFYGPTEAAVDVSSWYCDPSDSANTVPIGKPVANTQLYVLNCAMQLQAIGIPGELYIGGVQLARGYLQQPGLTEQVFVADPFSDKPGARLYRSGDQVRLRDNGVIEYIGRNDSQVKVRGMRIETKEIDTLLARHPSVVSCVTIVREDRSNDQRLVSYVVIKTEHDFEDKTFREHLRALLPGYMVPQHFVELDSLPYSTSGKLDHRALPLPEADADGAQTIIEPCSDIELMLLQHWRNALDLEHISTRDNFFDIGGHSLSATQMLSQLRQDLDINIPLRSFFADASIVGLAATIDELLLQQLENLSEADLDELISGDNRAG
jgi:amino acid adenylation domain-containing protein